MKPVHLPQFDFVKTTREVYEDETSMYCFAEMSRED